MINLNQSSLFIDDVKLMLVHQSSITCSQFSDRLTMLIEKRCMPMSIRSIVTSLERKQNVFSFVSCCLKIGSPDRKVGEAGPHELSGVGEDVLCGLEGAVTITIAVPGEGCNEEISRLNV